MLTIYDLLDAHGPAEVERWMSGDDTSIGLPLDEDEAEAMAALWPFWARPGQRWQPGPETITYYSAGRGFGKSLVVANVIGEAALEPERWGGEAMLVGITPADVRETNIQGPTGIVRVCEAYGYPRPEVRLSPPYSLTFPNPRGGGRGLHVRVASSNKPEHARGPNIGLLVGDEWAFFADVRDEQGLTTWEAAMNALRVGEERAVIVSSPSRKRAVREMLRRAEEPPCRACGATLPRSPRRRLSPLFSADTTEAIRECHACGATVIAEVRVIRASTLDNRAHLTGRFLERVESALASGSRNALGELGGEILDDDSTSPISSIAVHDLALATGRDPWLDVRAALGLVRVVVQVDPAVSAGEGSADTGLIVAGLRRTPQAPPVVFGLQDWSLPAAEVEGSPSRQWAPRAAILAALWRADAIHVETNQGGLEVIDPARRALASLTAEDLAPHTQDPTVIAAALAAARRARVEPVRRRTSKAARWDWASDYAHSGDLSLVRSPWLDPGHWETTRAHLLAFVPDPKGRATADLIDRGDALIAAAQVLLGAREEGEHRVVDPERSPVYTTGRIG